MTGFWFAFQNSFSGQVLEEGWTLTFYNVVFTVLPPIVLGVFDQFVGARMLDRYPELYQLGQQNKSVSLFVVFSYPLPCANASHRFQFSVRIFWQWIANALIHSFVRPLSASLSPSKLTLLRLSSQIIYAVTAVIFNQGLILAQGWIGGQWVWGTTLYLSALLTVLAKAALISKCVLPFPTFPAHSY